MWPLGEMIHLAASKKSTAEIMQMMDPNAVQKIMSLTLKIQETTAAKLQAMLNLSADRAKTVAQGIYIEILPSISEFGQTMCLAFLNLGGL